MADSLTDGPTNPIAAKFELDISKAVLAICTHGTETRDNLICDANLLGKRDRDQDTEQ